MSVESFDPGANALELSSEILTELMDAARRLDEENFGLTRERVQALAALARDDGDCDWGAAVTGVDSEGVVSLIRLFTLAEKLPGWEAGSRSPLLGDSTRGSDPPCPQPGRSRTLPPVICPR